MSVSLVSPEGEYPKKSIYFVFKPLAKFFLLQSISVYLVLGLCTSLVNVSTIQEYFPHFCEIISVHLRI